MSNASNSAQTFLRLSDQLKADLLQLQLRLQEMQENKAEIYQSFKTEGLKSFTRWANDLSAYKSSISEFPKELRQRLTRQGLMNQVEAFEAEFSKMMSSFKERSADVSFASLQKQAQNFANTLDEMESHPFVQKFVRGETVLSCKKNIQWGRKAGHVLFALAFVYLFRFSGLSQAWLWSITIPLIMSCVGLEVARHLYPRVNEWVCDVFRPVMREEEKHKINSSMFYILSILIVYLVFPIEIAMLTLLFLGLGDTVAGIVGVKFGKHRLNSSASVEGFLAGAATCAIICWVCAGYLFDTTLSGFSLLIFSVVGGLTGAVAEVSFKKLDDNFTIPVLSAPILWGLLKIFDVYK